jgi:hypothetical protein
MNTNFQIFAVRLLTDDFRVDGVEVKEVRRISWIRTGWRVYCMNHHTRPTVTIHPNAAADTMPSYHEPHHAPNPAAHRTLVIWATWATNLIWATWATNLIWATWATLPLWQARWFSCDALLSSWVEAGRPSRDWQIPAQISPAADKRNINMCVSWSSPIVVHQLMHALRFAPADARAELCTS